MIEAKDLRIGNILLDENNKLIEVETIHSDGVNYMDGHIYGTEYEYLTPIKITPDILEQVGFKEFIEPNWFKLVINNFSILFDTKENLISFNNSNDLKCEFLHDLQNLIYFNCNKQELPIDINMFKV